MGSIPTKLLKTFEILFIMEGMTRINLIIQDMPSERKLNVSLSMKIKGESTSVKVLPWDPFATFNVAVLIHSFVHIGCAFGTTILFLYS